MKASERSSFYSEPVARAGRDIPFPAPGRRAVSILIIYSIGLATPAYTDKKTRLQYWHGYHQPVPR